MTDEQLFLIVFFLFYIAESVFWISRNQVAFTGKIFQKYFLQYPDKYIGNEKGGLILANPLLPSRLVFIAEPLPLSMDDTAVCSVSTYRLNFSAESKNNQVRLVNWNDITSVNTIDNEIHINGQLFTKCSSSDSAEKWARIIQKIKSTQKPDRNSLIKKSIMDSFNADEIIKSRSSFSRISFPLRMLCNLLTAYVFIIAPLIIIQYGLMYTILNIFLLYVFFHLLTLITFIITKYKSKLRISKSDFITILIKVSLFPPALMHVNDYLSVKVMDKFHPLALGLELLPQNKFESMAKAWILKLKYPQYFQQLSEEKQKVIQNFNQMEMDHIKSILSKYKIDIDKLIAPKLSDDPNLKSYCPRCHTEYAIDKGYCSDCNDMELVPVSKLKESKLND